MYPTLYHLVHDLTGLSLEPLKLINTFGFMVALAFLAAARVLSAELARRHSLGLMAATRRTVTPTRPLTFFDVALSGLVAFVIGHKFFGVALGVHELHGGNDTQQYLLSTRGHFWAGVLCGVGWAAYRARDLGRGRDAAGSPSDDAEAEGTSDAAKSSTDVELLPQEHTLGITGAAALGGLVGAKVFHLLERPSTIVELIQNPSLSALFSGLTIYGGLIVGTLSVFWYCRRENLNFFHVADSTAPGLMLAYGIGRMGCQLAGDGDWGIDNAQPPPTWLEWLPSWAWSFDYPNNVLRAGLAMAEGGYPGYGTHLVPPVYPTPLYEIIMALACFGVLWLIRKHVQRPLAISGIYLMLNGLERFWIEKIRVNATYDLFGSQVTQAEIISVCAFVGGVVLLVLRLPSAGGRLTASPQAD